MWLSKLFVYFLLFSWMGWIYETTFCTCKRHRWENRGFLFGPVIPIYGVGADALLVVENLLWEAPECAPWWQIFLLGFFGSIVLEFSTHWTLEKLFHAYWWDYSKMPLNIQGRVCLPCSLGFGFAGLLVHSVLAPFVLSLTAPVPDILMELFSLVGMALIAADTTLTVSALTNFERHVIAIQESLNQHMEVFVADLQERTQATAAQIAQERERFSKEMSEHTVASMSTLRRSALRRAQGYRMPALRIEKEQAEQLFQRIKNRMPRKRG